MFHRSDKEADLLRELQFHLEEEAEERQAAGLVKQEARSAALRELGNLAAVQENTRATWGWTVLEQLGQDLRYTWRTMAANRTFSVLAVLSLALGIGANTAIYSFIDSILMRSLPVADPQSLVRLSWNVRERSFHGTEYHDSYDYDPKTGLTGGGFSYPAFELFRKNHSLFASLFGNQGAGKLNLTFNSQAEVANGEYVSGDYFRGLGVPPAAGRLPGPDDDRAGAVPVVAISFALSEKLFGGPANAAGQTVLINNHPFAVAGVTPPEFFGTDPDSAPDFYLPMHTSLILVSPNSQRSPASLYIDADYEWVDTMARLRPGVSMAQAQAALAPQFQQFESAFARERKDDLPKLMLNPGAGGLDSLRRRYSQPLYLLMTLVGLILAIACANIANLQLARAAARRREIAVRLSMGAGRSRVIRQLLTESLLLAVVGGALGVVFAAWGIRLLTLLQAAGREDFTLYANLNWHVLGVAAALSLLTGVLFGLAPALQATRVNLIPALKESRTGERRTRNFAGLSLSRVLVVSQIAITLFILVAAALFVRTLSNLEAIQLGFNRENLLTFELNARQAGHLDPEIYDFYNNLRNRFSQIAGVRSATLSELPLIGYGAAFTQVSVSGEPNVPVEKVPSSKILNVGPAFLSTMQIPMLLGREIDQRDGPNAPLVAVVNQEFVKTRIGDRNPLGLRIALPGDRCPTCQIEIIGVSANPRYGKLKDQPDAIVYLPFAQAAMESVSEMVFELRTAGNPLLYANTVRRIVRQADPLVPVDELTTQDMLIDGKISREITFARLCTAFALLALAIACVGLYGTVSYKVARRTGEIGIRMALGAPRSSVVWMVLREVLALAAIALMISVPAALKSSRLVESFLFGLKPEDPVAISVAAATLLCAALLAGYLPARKASRIDPMTALRHE